MSYRLGLLGGKLGHSFSPLIHGYIFKKINIDATYELFEITEEEIPTYLNMVRSGEIKALSVTIPYKEKVLKYLDVISEEAEKIHACNVITMKDGKLTGYNTDYFGFYNEVKMLGYEIKGRKCHLLGCGGAAKAISQALIDLGADLKMVVRESDLPKSTWFKNVITFDELDSEEIDIIVNATPVGMYPNVLDMPLKGEIATKANIVFDAVYNPVVTKLMTYAKEGFNGLPMLILQAIKAEELIFDVEIKEYDDIFKYVEGVVL